MELQILRNWNEDIHDIYNSIYFNLTKEKTVDFLFIFSTV